jgi:multimeric flavodoxin WrbA
MTGLTKTVMDRTYALGFPTLQLSGKVGGLIVTAGSRGCMNTANVFHMYFTYNHMLFAEFASGYAGGKGEITKNVQAAGATKEMVHQMIALIRSNFKYPGGFDVPMPRLVRKKYGL